MKELKKEAISMIEKLEEMAPGKLWTDYNLTTAEWIKDTKRRRKQSIFESTITDARNTIRLYERRRTATDMRQEVSVRKYDIHHVSEKDENGYCLFHNNLHVELNNRIDGQEAYRLFQKYPLLNVIMQDGGFYARPGLDKRYLRPLSSV